MIAMIDRARLRSDLVRDEGLRLYPYRDTAGKLTTGVGRCLDTNPMTAEESAIVGHDGRELPITKQQALYLLDNDIDKTLDELDLYLPWARNLDEVRQRVLANMAFNLGIRALIKFRNTLSCVQSGNYAAAAKGMLDSLWARQVGARAQRLAKMMETGEDSC